MTWPCFWVERTGDAVIELRRFTWSRDTPDPCPVSGGYHNASVAVAGVHRLRVTAGNYVASIATAEYRDDPRWPPACPCGYMFASTDEWQVNQDAIYVRPDTGDTWPARRLPVGALFDGYWNTFGAGDDGISLFCVLPPDVDADADTRGHWWHIDGPARNHEGGTKANAWTRTGDPRAVPSTVDVNPSIAAPGYHGYLRNGVLTDPV